MITIKNKRALEAIQGAGERIARILHDVKAILVPGVTTLAIDEWVAVQLKSYDLVSQTKGFRTYKHYSCVSINDEIVHGVPRADRVLKNGDLVTVDVCASWNGYCADSARSFVIGDVPGEAQKLIAVAQSALEKAIQQAQVGGRLSDISFAVQQEVEKNGFGIVREFCGHGIGKKMHEDPEIVNYGQPGRGPFLRAGMVFALEPMITYAGYAVKIDADGWTARTADGSLAAHVEDTVIITDAGPRVVTRFI